jgi:hypothetical protein
MTYQTFKHLAVPLCPLILSALGKKGTTRYYQNGPIHQMSDLPVLFDGLSAGLGMTF